MTLRLAFAATCSLSLSSIALAQDHVQSRIDSVVKAEMARQKIPGVGVAVIKGGEVMLAKGYGEANVEHHVPVTPETVFESGSVGKQFTSTAVMLLVQDGRIALTTPTRISRAASPTPIAMSRAVYPATSEKECVSFLKSRYRAYWPGLLMRSLPRNVCAT